jgi:hypothetical protein
MNDEYFLNQWFSRSLKRSRQTFSCASFRIINNCKPESVLNIDRSLFPINLRSSKCYLLPWIVSRHSSDNVRLFGHFYPSSLIASSHSFSFWLFLPYQCKLNIEIGNSNINGLTILLRNDKKYPFNKGKHLLIADRWIHIVLTKEDSQSNYRIWIDGQAVPKLSQYYTFLSEMERQFSLIEIVLFPKFDNNSLEPPNKIRVADVNAFKRCLTLVEIRANHEQQTSISQVQVGTYVNSNEYTKANPTVVVNSTISHINLFSWLLRLFGYC